MQAHHVVLLRVEKLSTRTTVRDFLVAKVFQSYNQLVPFDVVRGWLGFDFFNGFVCLCHVGLPWPNVIVTTNQLHHAAVNFSKVLQGNKSKI